MSTVRIRIPADLPDDQAHLAELQVRVLLNAGATATQIQTFVDAHCRPTHALPHPTTAPPCTT